MNAIILSILGGIIVTITYWAYHKMIHPENGTLEYNILLRMFCYGSGVAYVSSYIGIADLLTTTAVPIEAIAETVTDTVAEHLENTVDNVVKNIAETTTNVTDAVASGIDNSIKTGLPSF